MKQILSVIWLACLLVTVNVQAEVQKRIWTAATSPANYSNFQEILKKKGYDVTEKSILAEHWGNAAWEVARNGQLLDMVDPQYRTKDAFSKQFLIFAYVSKLGDKVPERIAWEYIQRKGQGNIGWRLPVKSERAKKLQVLEHEVVTLRMAMEDKVSVEQLEAYQVDVNRTDEELQTQLTSYLAELKTLEQTVAEQGSRLEGVEADIEGQVGFNQNQERQMQALQENLNKAGENLGSRMNGLETQLNETETRIAELEAADIIARNERSQSGQDIEAFKEEVKVGVSDDLTTLKTEVGVLTQGLEAKVNTLTAENAELMTKVDNIQNGELTPAMEGKIGKTVQNELENTGLPKLKTGVEEIQQGKFTEPMKNAIGTQVQEETSLVRWGLYVVSAVIVLYGLFLVFSGWRSHRKADSNPAEEDRSIEAAEELLDDGKDAGEAGTEASSPDGKPETKLTLLVPK